MPKIDKTTAEKELIALLEKWADDQEIPDITIGDFSHVFKSAVGYISSGKMVIQDEKIKVKNGDEWLEFGVPLGEAFMSMKGENAAGMIAFAGSMCKQAPKFFANGDARLTKKAMVIAGLFMHLP